METYVVRPPGGLDRLEIVERDDPGEGDHVVSTFFPHWTAGRPFTAVGNFAGTPGGGIDGMAATHVARPVSAFTRAPKGWSHPEAATITTSGLTAWRALVIDGALQAGQTVLTLGSGGVSLAALQLAKAMGAHVAATFSSDEKCDRLPDQAAEH